MKSMTGFGKHECNVEDYQIEIEIKSVNHRFLDLQIRLPREYNSVEMSLRKELKEQLRRGRVECQIYVKKTTPVTKQVVVNWPLLDSLLEQLTTAKAERYSELDFQPQSIVNGLINHADFFEILEEEKTEGAVEAYFITALRGALANLNQSRELEGLQLQEVLETYLTDFYKHVTVLQQMAVLFENEHQQKLTTKLTELTGGEVDESRLLTEVALLIERGDIHEELDRLEIHVKKLQELFQTKNSAGREMDFVIQEMNREVNTIGSKSAPMAIKEAVVQMKTILEKIREQVQNVE